VALVGLSRTIRASEWTPVLAAPDDLLSSYHKNHHHTCKSREETHRLPRAAGTEASAPGGEWSHCLGRGPGVMSPTNTSKGKAILSPRTPATSATTPRIAIVRRAKFWAVRLKQTGAPGAGLVWPLRSRRLATGLALGEHFLDLDLGWRACAAQ
jgi:hypothetical protein